MNRVCFIGLPASGKSMAAKKLGKQLSIPVVDIDTLYDSPLHYFWYVPLRVFSRYSYRRKILSLLDTTGEKWIIDGYHGKRMPNELWLQTDTVIFLDLPKRDLLKNALARYRHKRRSSELSHHQGRLYSLVWNALLILLFGGAQQRHLRRIEALPDFQAQVLRLKSFTEINEFLSKQ